MTIKRGESWGRQVPRPDQLRFLDTDAALAAALAEMSERPVAVGGGDLARTIGVSPDVGRDQFNELPIDLIEVRLDGGAVRLVCAHVAVRSPWWRGSWWFGPLMLVMNAEFLGRWKVTERGHPNDGRVEVLRCDKTMSFRQRVAARRRLPTGGHLPHPAIESRSISQGEWSYASPQVVVLDGRKVGRFSKVNVVVRPDAATIYG